MSYQCPACKRTFAEPGFCPFDGKALGVAADQQTMVSSHIKAQVGAETLIAPESLQTQLPEKHTKSGIGENTNQLKAISGRDGHADAIGSMRKGKGDNEYDRLIGQTLDGRYYVQRKIGEGGMGVVFAVKHAVIERPLAIKVLKKDVMRDNATIQRFVQEAKAASRIGHPNIVDVTDFGKTPEGMTYSVMEYVDGTTLSKVIKQNAPLPPARAVRIAMQISRALAAAHAKGIVHRDLKPENVFLVDRDGRPDFVKIVDFGIAKVQPIEGTEAGPRLTRAGSVFGTPEYMAPEQAAGRGDTDHRVDIYALGCILYEMLVGKTPLKGDSMIRTIAMQMLDPIVPPTQVNPDLNIPAVLEAIVMKTLEKKRELRYNSMNDLLSALEQIAPRLSETPSHSLPPLPPGADPTYAPSTPTSVISPGASSTAKLDSASESSTLTRPRRAKPSTRQVHEPEFTAPGRPLSFTHLNNEAETPAQSSRVPMILAGLLMLLLGAGGTIFLLMKLQGDDTKQPIADTPKDAAVIAELRDAGTPLPLDDAQVIVDVPVDAGTPITTNRRDAGVGGVNIRIDKNKPVTVEVLTRPAEADVFIGPNYRGPSGVKIQDRYGAKVHIECKTARMKGSIDVVFDGKLTAVMCTATRDRFCVPGIKNPFDDCEEDPNAGP
jgi:serine/threonine protein kinase